MNYLGLRSRFPSGITQQLVSLTLTAFCLLSCADKSPELRFQLLDNQDTGIDFSNSLNATPELNILNYIYYYNGGGVAAGDFNSDGLIDLYFTANQEQDALFLNNGEFKFSSILSQTGITNTSGWTTGVTTVDINQDGLLDLYICKVNGLRGEPAHNLLYVNQGNNPEGIPQFKELAKDYGLDFKGFGTQATFFDYDKDGDLDAYLLNHNTQPNSNYANGKNRKRIDSLSGDRLYNNNNGIYTNVSNQAGIFQSAIGYGLGVSVSDINNDSYPDIYVGNDFFENDYLYINQKDGTFIEVVSTPENPLGHTTHYSMGNDIADINNDGFTDLISVDMLPEDLVTYKSSGVEFGYQTYSNYLRNGYAPQYMQNTLHINNGALNFSETAHQSGLAATEWSWSPLLADLDNDGLNDIFITNGILGATNDMDFINFIANTNIQEALSKGMGQPEMEFIKRIPEKKTANYLYKNLGNGHFTNTNINWAELPESFSNGAVYADLDNDGDLDLVVNNVNQKAFVYRNNTQKDSLNFIGLRFKGPEGNIFGIGTKASVYTNGTIQIKENYVTRGYLSSVAPQLHFGLGAVNQIDSLVINWPNGARQSVINPTVNTYLDIAYSPAIAYPASNSLELVTARLDTLIAFTHKENASLAFNRNPLIPYATTNLGPAIAVADVHADGLDDVFLGGGKGQTSSLLVQQETGNFVSSQEELFSQDKLSEDVSAVFFNANSDRLLDLLVVSAGDEFTTGAPIQPRLYIHSEAGFVKDSLNFKDVFVNASTVQVFDFNKDGHQDIFIGSMGKATQFGSKGSQFLFKNDGNGNFTEVTSIVAPTLNNLESVTQVTITDVNMDSWPDLVTVGHWEGIHIFYNNKGSFESQNNPSLNSATGLWNTIKTGDFDQDGDIDFVAGNWGLNTRLKASENAPVNLYINDFNGNGQQETLVTYFQDGIETLLVSKDELSKQLPGINKEFLLYNDFAKAGLNQVFSSNLLSAASKKQVNTLSSVYIENLGNGDFNISSLPFQAQISQVNDIFVTDLNSDSFPDLILVGNNHHISTQLGRLDALHGAVFINNKENGFLPMPELNLGITGVVRGLKKIDILGQPYLLVVRNNAKTMVVRIPKNASNR